MSDPTEITKLLVVMTSFPDILAVRFQVWLQLTDRLIPIGSPMTTPGDVDGFLAVLKRLPDFKAMPVYGEYVSGIHNHEKV